MNKNVFFISGIVFAAGYAVLFYILQFFFAKTGVYQITPSSGNIKLWDVGFYESIARKGYDVNSDNTGFFILFPFLWKLTHLGIWGIVGINILLFSLGFGILMRTINDPDKHFWLLCLSLPPVYFAFIPYTEALFFFLGSWVLYAVKNQKTCQIWISLMLISMVRPTAFFLLPAFLIMALLSAPPQVTGKSIVTYLGRYVVPILLGLGIFIIWQYLGTGIWFAYFRKQSTVWGHRFSWPEIPFSNIENADWRYHWLSALALFIDFIAVIILCRQLVLWVKKSVVTEDKNLLLSLGYLSMVLVSVLFLNPKYGGHNTNVMGACRYTFVTPFLFYTLHYFFKQQYSRVKILCLFLAVVTFTSFFRSFNSLNHFIIIGLVPTLIILAFILSRTHKENNWLLVAIIAFNFLVQLNLFQQFIGNLYMD